MSQAPQLKHETRGLKLAGAAVALCLHLVLCWELVSYVTEPESWRPRYERVVVFDAATTLEMLEFIEKRRLTDKAYEEDLFRNAVTECRTCSIDYENVSQARSYLTVLAKKDAVVRFQIAHFLSVGSLALLLVLSLYPLASLFRARKRGAMHYVAALGVFVPVAVALLGLAGITEDVRAFRSAIPALPPQSLRMLAAAAAMALLFWPGVWVRRRRLAKRDGSESHPWSRYRSPRQRLKDAAKRQVR